MGGCLSRSQPTDEFTGVAQLFEPPPESSRHSPAHRQDSVGEMRSRISAMGGWHESSILV
ncbi:hypothetical protein Q5752_001348 [Cryptotrichosporon argae]